MSADNRYSEGYTAGERWGRKKGEQLAAEAAREVARLTEEVRALRASRATLIDHIEDMADSLDDHVTRDDIRRLLVEALAIARGATA